MKRKFSAADSQTMLGGAMVLTMSIALVKIIGLVYKLPLANAITVEGMGYFHSAYEIYLPILAIAIAGLPIAVSRMVSQRYSTGRFHDVRAIRHVARRLYWFTGGVGTLLIILLAYPYAYYSSSGGLESLPAIFAIAPTVFFCCAMAAYRGYYEGMRNMVPTAASQVIEALCKLVIGLALAILVMRIGQNEFAAHGTVFGRAADCIDTANSMLYPWAAAAAIMGITLGSIFGLIYLWARFRKHGDGITPEQLRLSPPPERKRKLLREMFVMAIPMVISSSILNLTNFIDAFIVQRQLRTLLLNHPETIENIYGAAFASAGTLPENRAIYIWGVYSIAMTFRTLIPTVIAALGMSSLPVIAAAWEQRRRDTIQHTINTVLRMTMMIALPAGFGMAVLARPIMELFYGRNNPGMYVHAAPILVIFGIFTALMALSMPVVNILQGIGRMDIPVKTLIAGMFVKIGVNYFLVRNPYINIAGAAVGTVLFFIVVVGINLFMLLRVTKTKVKINSVLIKPLFCACLSAATAWLMSSLAARLLPGMLDSTRMVLLGQIVLATGFAAAVYGISMLFTRAVGEEDLQMLPGGKKIAKVLAKFKLLG